MGRPLFCGSNDADQVSRIFKVIGTPNADSWPSMSSMPKYSSNLQLYPGKKLSQILPRLGPVGLDLLERLLQPDPGKRISAREAMRHPYFTDLQGVSVQAARWIPHSRPARRSSSSTSSTYARCSSSSSASTRSTDRGSRSSSRRPQPTEPTCS